MLSSMQVDVKIALAIIPALVVAKVIHGLILYPYFLSPLKKAPGPQGSLTSLRYLLYGEFPAILREEAGVLQSKWAQLYGMTVRAVGPFGLERMMFLSPAAMQKIFSDDWTDYPRPDFMRKALGSVVGYGLLTVTGDEHRMMRRAMNPAFSIQSLTAQTDMYYEPIYGLVNIWKKLISESQTTKSEGAVLFMHDWMSKVTLDIICETAFGYRADSLHDPKNELAEAYHTLNDQQSGQNLSALMGLLSIPGGKLVFESEWLYEHRHWLGKLPLLKPIEIVLTQMRRVKRISASILEEKIADATAILAGDSAISGKKDVMSLLVQARMQESEEGSGYRMSDEMMMYQVLTFLGAGHETTASGLSWTIWLLATHPEIQSRLREEVSPIIAENPTPDFRSLKRMEYLEHVVMEGLRLYPPVPMTFRKAAKSDYIDGIWVPKGTLFYMPIRVINTYKGFWGEDAEEFRPERWKALPPTCHPILSFQSFIVGPHHCIGKTMAIIEMKAIIAIIIANFSFEPAYYGQRAKPTAAITMRPDDNLPLRVKAISPLKGAGDL